MKHSVAFATIAELASLLASKKISKIELLSEIVSKYQAGDASIKSALEIFDINSLTQEFQEGSTLLNGIPGVVKDNICNKGRITSCSSKMLANYSASYDATAVQKLKQIGAPIVARANCDEFAMGCSTETSAFQKTTNPWDTSRVPGGSSGGSIAAVAAGFVPWALGSETGGSVRQPAALCGITGLKPTYGRISRYGLIAYASSFDQIGIATRTAYDTAVVLEAIAGYDPHDSTSSTHQVDRYTQEIEKPLRKLKIGIIQNALHAEGIDPEVCAAVEKAAQEFEKLGHTLVPITLEAMECGAGVYFILSRAEAASNLARFDGVRYGMREMNEKTLSGMYKASRRAGFGLEVRKRILMGNYVLSVGHADAFYKTAKTAQDFMRAEVDQKFKEVDLMLLPTAPSGAFKFNAFDHNKLQMDLQDYFTCPVNITGHPALSIPCGFTTSGLPLGVQLFGPTFGETLLLSVAHAYQKITDWHTHRPSLTE